MSDAEEFGRFLLLERIGAGGMGEVFRAEMRGLDAFSRIVVVKRMLPDLAAEPDAVTMFVEEAKLAARLIHPHIVATYDFGKLGLRYYLVMEYVAGVDLSRLLAHMGEQKEALPFGVSVAIASALLEALAFAHDLRGDDGAPVGLVHRDVAPSNVLLGTNGEIKLTDFGIAKTRERMEHTRAGTIKGKHHYMSPEQAAGEPLDARSDLWALGVVLYKLLTGHRPFRGSSGQEILAAVRSGRYAPPDSINREVGPAMSALLARALQLRPEHRFQTAGEFRQALLTQAARDDIAVDAEPLRRLVADAAAAFALPENVPTIPGRMSHTPERQATEVLAPAPAPKQLYAPSALETAPTTTSVVIQGKHVVLAALALVALIGATVFVALRFTGGARSPHTVRIALRMYPAQQQWFKEHVFEPFASAHGCKVEVVEFNSTEELSRILGNGEADVAKVDIEHAPLLVELGRLQRIPPLAERVDAEAFAEVRKSLRPEAARLGTFHTMVGDDMYLLPRKLETYNFVFRRSLVELAARELPKQRAALDARLRELIGHGLPEHFEMRGEPALWTSWDLIAASWVWAHTPIRGHTQPRYALRAEKRVLHEVIAAGAPPHDPWRVSSAMVDLFYEYALLRELDVLHPDTFQPIDYAKAREMLANGELAAFIEPQIDVGILTGNGHGMPQIIDDPRDVDVAPLPRLCDLDRSDGAALVPEPLTEVWGWGWGVPRTAREPELAMRLILDILSREHHAAELEEFPILRVRADVTPAWPVSRRMNQIGDAQLGPSRTRFVDWPKRAGEIEQIELRIEHAFRDIVVDRHYRGDTQPIDRSVIETRLHAALDKD